MLTSSVVRLNEESDTKLDIDADSVLKNTHKKHIVREGKLCVCMYVCMYVCMLVLFFVCVFFLNFGSYDLRTRQHLLWKRQNHLMCVCVRGGMK